REDSGGEERRDGGRSGRRRFPAPGRRGLQSGQILLSEDGGDYSRAGIFGEGGQLGTRYLRGGSREAEDRAVRPGRQQGTGQREAARSRIDADPVEQLSVVQPGPCQDPMGG